MGNIIFKAVLKLFYGGLLISIVFLSCSQPKEELYSKATDLKEVPVIIVEDVTSGNQTNEYEYQILNTGKKVLKLTNFPGVVITGADASDYSIIEQPSMQEIGTGQSTSFKIRFDPETSGTKNANIYIPNNSKSNPYTLTISKNAQQYLLTINSNNRGDVSPSITFVNKLNTTIIASPKSNFYFYKWKVISGTVTIDLPNSSITSITVNGCDAVIAPVFYAFDPNKTSGINLEAIQSRGTHDYALIISAKTWQNAQNFCSANAGGYIATITSGDENNFIHTMRGGSNNIWLGGKRNAEDNFYWISGEKFDYENWDSGEPNNQNWNEDCIEMRSNGEWNDTEYDKKRDFICEWGH